MNEGIVEGSHSNGWDVGGYQVGCHVFGTKVGTGVGVGGTLDDGTTVGMRLCGRILMQWETTVEGMTSGTVVGGKKVGTDGVQVYYGVS
jgi:hypothetical protein